MNCMQVIFGSALCALEDKRPDIGVESIKKLIDVLDNKFVIPERHVEKEPMFAAEHVYSIQGERGRRMQVSRGREYE